MVVLARPRDPDCADVTLEDEDVTEDFLEKPYVELLGSKNDSSALQRSLSARVRRRERVGAATERASRSSSYGLIKVVFTSSLPFRSDLQTSLAPCSARCLP